MNRAFEDQLITSVVANVGALLASRYMDAVEQILTQADDDELRTLISESQARRTEFFRAMRTESCRQLSVEVRASTVDQNMRSVDAVISTENPVPMYDHDRGERVDEVLLASGAEFPSQVVMLDAHRRESTDDVIGSVRRIRTEGRLIVGSLFFAADRKSTEIFAMVRDGHVTDVSAGYVVLARTFVPSGKTQSIDGRTFSGPVSVVTKWKLREVSVVPIGADDQAKLRRGELVTA